jgi:hypothetical protein
MSGLPGDVVLDADWNVRCMEAALLMARNDRVSHEPDTSWPCYSAAGAEAAANSDLYLGREGPAAVEGYMDDPGAENYFVGHRRWILYPPQQQMGTGSIPQHLSFRAANALWVTGAGGGRPPEPEWVAWPPPGHVPYQIMPRRSGRWSFSYPKADFGRAQVTVRHGGAAVPVVVESSADDRGYADNTLVWIPEGVPTGVPGEDLAYEVTLGDVIIGGLARTFRYTVILIDPDRVPAAVAPSLLSQPSDQAVRVGGSVSFEVQAAGTQPLSFQWRFNEGPLEAGTNAMLSIAAATLADAGFYDVVVTNAAGGVTSDPARLAVETRPAPALGWLVKDGDMLTLTWGAPAILQRSDSLSGTWTNLPAAASPFNVTLEGPAGFFRLTMP